MTNVIRPEDLPGCNRAARKEKRIKKNIRENMLFKYKEAINEITEPTAIPGQLIDQAVKKANRLEAIKKFRRALARQGNSFEYINWAVKHKFGPTL